MKFELIQLPYEANALEPVISARTISFHYDKHLRNYVNTLNKLIENTPFEAMSLEEIVKQSDGPIFNNAGQVLNHNLYFTQFSPTPKAPNGKLAEAINSQWGSLENFQKEFSNAGVTLFGSGWAWLSKNQAGELVITKEPNAMPTTSITKTAEPTSLTTFGKSWIGKSSDNDSNRQKTERIKPYP